MTAPRDRIVARWRDDAEALASRVDDVAWVRGLREEALARFVELGLPHRRLEDWRHTSLAALERVDWSGPPEPGARLGRLADLVLAEDVADRVVMVDGRIAPDTRPVAPFRSIAAARQGDDGEALLREVMGRLVDLKTDAFAALGTAMLDDGVLLEVPRGERRDRPLHVVVASTVPDRIVCPRLAVVARAGSSATLVVEHVTLGEGARLASCIGEIVLEENSRLDVVFVQRESAESILISNVRTRQSRDSRLALHTLTLGGALVRNGLEAMLAEPGAEVDLRGLFVGDGRRLVDNHTLADHAVPHTTSRELYKGVLGGSSHGVFRGRVVVRPDAQKTDSSQSNPNLLLTARAEIDTQPQLEIYADDVKCSHGSTIGRLDEDALFYLRSRGIGIDEARVMLTRGFASEIVDALDVEALRSHVAVLVEKALASAIGESREAVV